jgi:hypothetical protein
MRKKRRERKRTNDDATPDVLPLLTLLWPPPLLAFKGSINGERPTAAAAAADGDGDVNAVAEDENPTEPEGLTTVVVVEVEAAEGVEGAVTPADNDDDIALETGSSVLGRVG